MAARNFVTDTLMTFLPTPVTWLKTERITSLPDAHDVQAVLSYSGKQHGERKAKFTMQKAGQASQALPQPWSSQGYCRMSVDTGDCYSVKVPCKPIGLSGCGGTHWDTKHEGGWGSGIVCLRPIWAGQWDPDSKQANENNSHLYDTALWSIFHEYMLLRNFSMLQRGW